MKDKGVFLNKPINPGWLYMAIVIAVAAAIWAADFKAVADVTKSELIKENVITAAQMKDSDNPYDRIEKGALVIEPGAGDKVFSGEADLSKGDALDVSFTAVNTGNSKVKLYIDLYADGFDDQCDEAVIRIKPGKKEEIHRTIEYYRGVHPDKCSFRVFTADDASLRITDLEVDQAANSTGGNKSLYMLSSILRILAFAALAAVIILVVLNAGNKGTKAKALTGYKSDRKKNILLYPGVMLAVTAFLCVIYRKADLTLPLIYQGGDEMGVYYYSGMIDRYGVSLVDPLSGGLTGADMFDYPYSDKLSFACVRFIGLFTDNPYLITNLFYFLNFYLIALIAVWVARTLGVSRINSAFIGILFAFSPYIQMRYTHVWLTPYYMLPIACLLCIYIMRGRLSEEQDKCKRRQLFWAGMIMAFACAFNGMYYAYFACAILAASMVIRLIYTRGRNIRKEVYPLAYIASVIGGVVINIIPNLIYWYLNGTNPAGELAVRNRSDAELYGLKLVQMIIPRPQHRIGLFNRIAEGYQRHYPLVTENITAALGIVASIGLIISLLLLFSEKNKYKEISWLNLSVFMIATIGGISSIISVAVVIPMRCYNRMSLIIMFMSLLLIGMLLDGLSDRIRPEAAIALSLCVLALGIFDQTIDYAPYDTSGLMSTRSFMKQVENNIGAGSMVYVLPYDNWPTASVPGSYGMFITCIEAEDLHWSYGAMEGRGEAEWQKHVSETDAPEMISKIKFAGYKGIYLDKNLYSLKYGEEAADAEIQSITEAAGTQPIISEDSLKYFWKISQ